MNPVREAALGLILLMGGEGDAARRAGDALLAERIQLAIEVGGFERLKYGSWDRVPGKATQIGFTDIEVEREHGELHVSTARVDALSYNMFFDNGAFASTESHRSWTFDRVEIQRSGFWSTRMRLVATELEPNIDGPAAQREDCRGGPVPCEVWRRAREPVAYFSMAFSESGEMPLTLLLADASSCAVARSRDMRGAESLQSWGRAFLASPESFSWEVFELPCEPGWDQSDTWIRGEQLTPLEGDALIHTVTGTELLSQAPVLLDTLFNLVAESYAYLLE